MKKLNLPSSCLSDPPAVFNIETFHATLSQVVLLLFLLPYVYTHFQPLLTQEEREILLWKAAIFYASPDLFLMVSLFMRLERVMINCRQEESYSKKNGVCIPNHTLRPPVSSCEQQVISKLKHVSKGVN